MRKLDVSFKLVTWNACICVYVVHLSHHGIFLELFPKTKKHQYCSQTSYFNTRVYVIIYVLLVQQITLSYFSLLKKLTASIADSW